MRMLQTNFSGLLVADGFLLYRISNKLGYSVLAKKKAIRLMPVNNESQ